MEELDLKFTISSNLRYYMDKNNIARYKICRDLGIPYSTFNEWYVGRILPRLDTLYKVADYINIKITDLLIGPYGEVEKQEPNAHVIDLYNSLSRKNQLEAVHYMRFLKTINSSTESDFQISGNSLSGAKIKYGDGYSQDIKHISNIPSDADYALIIKSDSMEPLIKNGQLIYIRKTTRIENGNIAVVEVDGAITCKKIYKKNNNVELYSLNTTYEPVVIKKDNLKIIGEVIL